MPDAAIRIDRLETFQISLHFAAQIAFNLDLVVRDCVNDLVQLLRRKVFCAQIRIDIGLLENAFGCAESNPLNVSERDLDAFLRWNFNSK